MAGVRVFCPPPDFMIRIREEQIQNCEYKLIAEVDGIPVGELVYELFVFDSHSSIIANLEVDPNYRRRGIGTNLIETAIEQIFKRRYMTRIWLQDGSGNGVTSRIVTKIGFQKAKQVGGLSWELGRTHSSGGRALA